VWRIARQIRIDRRVAERVTLQDMDGAVLFEGVVRWRVAEESLLNQTRLATINPKPITPRPARR